MFSKISKQFIIATAAIALNLGMISCSQVSEENNIAPLAGLNEKVMNEDLHSISIFIVKDLNGKVIKKFDFLQHAKEVETNLIRLGRNQDAKNFVATYDLSTGIMKPFAVKYLSQKYPKMLWLDQTALVYGTHLAQLGWSLGEASAGQLSGTTGQSRRLEAFYLKNTQSWDPTSPKIRYSAKVMNSFWDSQRRMEFEEVCGTTGQSRALEFIRIFSEPTDANSLSYHPTYTVHIQNHYDRTASDGLSVGVAGYQIEALTVRIYKY